MLACPVGFGDADQGDFEAEGFDLTDVVGDLAAEGSLPLVVLLSERLQAGDAFYASAAARGEALVDAWLRQKGSTDDRES